MGDLAEEPLRLIHRDSLEVALTAAQEWTHSMHAALEIQKRICRSCEGFPQLIPICGKPHAGSRKIVNKTEAAGTRTQDLRIKSPLLYQLSYNLKCFATTPSQTREAPDFAALSARN